ncbi:MAG: SdrD B-like domain-containing protein [Planctomycetaceae bacterium]
MLTSTLARKLSTPGLLKKWSHKLLSGKRRKKGRFRLAPFELELLESRVLLTAQINGAVYHDLNADGVRDQGEKGLVNWTVFLDQNQNGIFDAGEESDITDADGKFKFTNLAAGDYRVAEILKTDWTATNPVSGYIDVTLNDGDDTAVEFLNEGVTGTGAITGNVWHDLNGDGIKDAGDTGIAGWTVYLDLNENKELDPEDPFVLTDGDGNYLFEGILGGAPGNTISYEVQQVFPVGWEGSPGFDENLTAEVIEGETTVLPDFANTTEAISGVSGTVYHDLNGNGIKDTGEPGLQGWQVYADLNVNNVLDAGEPFTTTNASGAYSILGLTPGTHRIAEVRASTYFSTNPATGYQNVATVEGDTTSNVNFGNKLRTDGAIGGVIYVDRNEDGVRDPGEEGLSGITVFLDLDSDGVLDPEEPSMITGEDLFYTPDVDEAGRYRFDHLAGGSYIVRHLVPDVLSDTPASEREHTIELEPGEDRDDVHSGDRYRPSEIHGVKFEDINGNGLRDIDEPGIEGVTIYIDLDRDNVLDVGEPTTLTGPDGSYSFDGLETDSYVVREVVPEGYVQTFPETTGGVLWPEGVSNPAVGDVTPELIEVSLAKGETHTETVSLTLPTTGALTNMVDVFLLFDDTGSFTANSPIVRAAFPNIIAELQTRLPGIDLGFGVGRLEEYGNFAAEYATGRPFVLNQPIIASDVAGFASSIQAALDHVAPGYGGDRPETVIEALYQLVTGAGFDGNNNGSVLDSGPAGLLSTQVSPGTSGDVPSFASFVADLANGVLPASGTIGGAGFRSGALPIIITATDTGFAYQANGDTNIVGLDGLTLPVTDISYNGRGTTPFSSGAGIQETITALNALGALVIGLGTNDSDATDPRIGLEALASLTGAINKTATSITNGTPNPIDTNDPFYFKIGTGGDPLVGNIADGIVAAIDGAVTSVNVNVTLRSSDPRVHIDFTPGVINGLGSGDTATFDVTFTGDGRPHRFDLQFVREGTNVVLGSIPIVLGTPIAGDGYEYEDCEDGEISNEINFGNQLIVAPTDLPYQEDFTDGTADQIGYHGAARWGVTPAGGNNKLFFNGSDSYGLGVAFLENTSPLPANFEFAADMASYSATGFWNDGFLVFDYQGPNDFKYAGMFTGQDEWIIGHYQGNWGNRLATASRELYTDIEYSLHLKLNGDHVALFVDGLPVVDATFTGGIGDGNVGVAGYNSRTGFDNLWIDTTVTAGQSEELPYANDFETQTAPSIYYYNELAWGFTNGANKYLRANTSYLSNPARHLATAYFPLDSTKAPADIQIAAKIASKNGASAEHNGYIIFDYHHEHDFKYAGFDANTNQWVIGHYQGNWSDVRAMVDWDDTSRSINVNQWYSLNVDLTGTSVSLKVDGELIASYDFGTPLNQGGIGLALNQAFTWFDDLSINQAPAMGPIESFGLPSASVAASEFTYDSTVWSSSGRHSRQPHREQIFHRSHFQTMHSPQVQASSYPQRSLRS